ncbi:MAG: M18 family aminopeptidase [Oscillospiraceae bacterium]|nr:M18 family aminopeptidase [Oscillospiraceae bacterium]
MDNRIRALCDFLNASHSLYHAQAYIMDLLQEAGYTRLYEHEKWDLVPGGKYFLVRGGTAVLAFRIPLSDPKGFLLSASHADRPCFKVKENFTLDGKYTRMAVERYGGQLLFTWLDRPLSLAGRIIVETEDGIQTKLIDIDRDLLLIPNVAIHMNRQVNDGYKWNPAVDLLPLIGGREAAGKLEALLEQQAGGRILGHDLYLYVRQQASVWGIDEEYISGAALDDLECAWGCTQGFLKASESESVPVLCIFDSEEVGSGSVQGAGSMLLPDVLRRICVSCGWDMDRMLAQSFMVSADNAHALHPNHPELGDPTNAPVMGKGIVLKHNANLSYCTDGVSAAIFRKICARAQAPLQTYYNRADIPGGSTLGRISLGKVSILTADIGLPQLAMHSCYETAATADAIALENAMTAYYSACLEVTQEGYRLK